MSCFPEPDTSRKNKIKVELNLSNYATKSSLKNTIGVDTSNFKRKFDFDSLKSDANELDIDKSKNVPSGLDSLKSR